MLLKAKSWIRKEASVHVYPKVLPIYRIYWFMPLNLVRVSLKIKYFLDDYNYNLILLTK